MKCGYFISLFDNRKLSYFVFTFFWYLKIVNLLLARRIVHISFWWVLAQVLKSFRGRTDFERGMTLNHKWEGHHQEQKLCKGEGLLRLYRSLGGGITPSDESPLQRKVTGTLLIPPRLSKCAYQMRTIKREQLDNGRNTMSLPAQSVKWEDLMQIRKIFFTSYLRTSLRGTSFTLRLFGWFSHTSRTEKH